MMRHVSLWSVLAFAFVLVMPAQAQEAGNLADDETPQAQNVTTVARVNVYNAKVLMQEGRAYDLVFELQNDGDVQTGLKYIVELYEKDQQDIYVLAHQQTYDDVIGLDTGERITKELTYTIPDSFSGGYSLRVLVANDRGLEFSGGQFDEIMVMTASSGMIVEVTTCEVFVADDGTPYIAMKGVDIDATEKLLLRCNVKNDTASDISYTPQIQTHLRTAFGDIVEESTGEPMTLLARSEEKIEIEIPIVQTPQSYQANISFVDSSGAPIANDVNARYVVRGESATVQNASFDRSTYATGDTAHVQVLISGLADSFPDARDTEAPEFKGLSYGVLMTSDGKKCAEPISGTFVDDQVNGGFLQLDIPIIEDCVVPHIAVVAKDHKGQTLDQKDFALDTEIQTTPIEDQSEKSSPNIFFIILGITAIVIIIILIVRSAKKPPARMSMFIGVIAIGMGMFFFGNSVSADSYCYTYATNSGALREQDLSMCGWSSVSSDVYRQCDPVVMNAGMSNNVCGNQGTAGLRGYAEIDELPARWESREIFKVHFNRYEDARETLCQGDEDGDGIQNWEDASPKFHNGPYGETTRFIDGKWTTFSGFDHCRYSEELMHTYKASVSNRVIHDPIPDGTDSELTVGDHYLGSRFWGARWETACNVGNDCCSYDINTNKLDPSNDNAPCYNYAHEVRFGSGWNDSKTPKFTVTAEACVPPPPGKCGSNSDAVSPTRWYPDGMIDTQTDWCETGSPFNDEKKGSETQDTETQGIWKCMGSDDKTDADDVLCTAEKACTPSQIPALTFDVGPVLIEDGNALTANWDATQATNCTSPSFVTGTTNGTHTWEPTFPAGTPHTYTLTCENPGGGGNICVESVDVLVEKCKDDEVLNQDGTKCLVVDNDKCAQAQVQTTITELETTEVANEGSVSIFTWKIEEAHWCRVNIEGVKGEMIQIVDASGKKLKKNVVVEVLNNIDRFGDLVPGASKDIELECVYEHDSGLGASACQAFENITVWKDCPSNTLECDDHRCVDIAATSGVVMLNKDGVSSEKTMDIALQDVSGSCMNTDINCTATYEGGSQSNTISAGDSKTIYIVPKDHMTTYKTNNPSVTRMPIAVSCEAVDLQGRDHDSDADPYIEFRCLNAECTTDDQCQKDQIPASSIDVCKTECSSLSECTDSTGVIKEVQP